MMVDWAGNAMFGGEVFARCGADSGSGIPLTTVRSLGEHEVYISNAAYTYEAFRVGRVIMVNLRMTKDTATSAGANLLDVVVDLPTPYGGFATSGSFFRSYAIGIMVLKYSDNQMHLRVRNATSSSLPAFSDELWATITYITAY